VKQCHLMFVPTFKLPRFAGAIIIVVGLYALIWGKNKDHVNQTDKENNFDKHKLAFVELPVSSTDFEQINQSRQYLAVNEAAKNKGLRKHADLDQFVFMSPNAYSLFFCGHYHTPLISGKSNDCYTIV
jgi:hypothetical protein